MGRIGYKAHFLILFEVSIGGTNQSQNLAAVEMQGLTPEVLAFGSDRARNPESIDLTLKSIVSPEFAGF